MTDESDKRTWNERKRIAFWIGFIGSVGMASTLVLTMGKWFYTRASIEDVQQVAEQKADKETVKETVQTIEKRIDKSERLLGVVHVNLIRLMEHSQVEPTKKGSIEFNEVDP